MEVIGHVYLFRSAAYYKIGCTQSGVQNRLRASQHGNPLEVVLVHFVPSDDPFRAEKYLHLKFAEKRVRNEWFELDDKDVAWFMKIKSISSQFLDRIDLTRKKPPARMTMIEMRCRECGVVFKTEQNRTIRKYCSELCADRYIGKIHYERNKQVGNLPYKPRPQIAPAHVYGACIVCNCPLPIGIGPCCSSNCAIKYLAS